VIVERRPRDLLATSRVIALIVDIAAVVDVAPRG